MPYSNINKSREWKRQYYKRRKDYFKNYPKLHGHPRSWHNPDEVVNRAKRYERLHWAVLFLWDKELCEPDSHLLTKLEAYV